MENTKENQQNIEGADDFFFGIEKKGDMTNEEFEDTLHYLENHPLFMKEVPKDISENENLQAIQNLVFEDEPENIANYCNEKGNATWKKGPTEKYFLYEAIKSYDEGINQNFDDDAMKAKMWSNKAMMQFKLKNFRDSIESCKMAIKLNPSFIKPYYRCAMALFTVSRYQESLDIINQGIKIESNQEMQKLKQQIEKTIQERVEREKEKENSELIQKNQLYTFLANKNILIGKQTIEIPGAYQQQITFDENKKIHVPICLLYPEFSQMDFIQDSVDDDLLINQLEVAFQDGLPWEQENPQKYYSKLQDIQAFVELNSTEPYYLLPKQKKSNKKGFCQISLEDTILKILQVKNHVVPMVLQLYIVSKRSPFYNMFMGQNQIIKQ